MAKTSLKVKQARPQKCTVLLRKCIHMPIYIKLRRAHLFNGLIAVG